MKKSFRQFSNCPMLVQFLKNIKITLKMVTDQSKFLKTCQKYLVKTMYKMYKQLANFMDKYFSIFRCTFRKGNSTQQCLIVLIKKKLKMEKFC